MVNTSYTSTFNDILDASVKTEVDCKRIDEEVRNKRSKLGNELTISKTLKSGRRIRLEKQSHGLPPNIAGGITLPTCKTCGGMQRGEC